MTASTLSLERERDEEQKKGLRALRRFCLSPGKGGRGPCLGPAGWACTMGSNACTGLPFAPLSRRPLSSAERSLPSSVLTLAAAGRQPRRLTSGAVFPQLLPTHSRSGRGSVLSHQADRVPGQTQLSPQKLPGLCQVWRPAGAGGASLQGGGSRRPPFPSLVVFSHNSRRWFVQQALPSAPVRSACQGSVTCPLGRVSGHVRPCTQLPGPRGSS